MPSNDDADGEVNSTSDFKQSNADKRGKGKIGCQRNKINRTKSVIGKHSILVKHLATIYNDHGINEPSYVYIKDIVAIMEYTTNHHKNSNALGLNELSHARFRFFECGVFIR